MLAVLYPTNKAMREAVGKPLHYQETSLFGPEYRDNGKLVFVGPSAHNRKFYGAVTMKNGLIASVK